MPCPFKAFIRNNLSSVNTTVKLMPIERKQDPGRNSSFTWMISVSSVWINALASRAMLTRSGSLPSQMATLTATETMLDNGKNSMAGTILHPLRVRTARTGIERMTKRIARIEIERTRTDQEAEIEAAVTGIGLPTAIPPLRSMPKASVNTPSPMRTTSTPVKSMDQAMRTSSGITEDPQPLLLLDLLWQLPVLPSTWLEWLSWFI